MSRWDQISWTKQITLFKWAKWESSQEESLGLIAILILGWKPNQHRIYQIYKTNLQPQGRLLIAEDLPVAEYVIKQT